MEPFPKSKRWSNLSLLIELFLVLTQLQRGNDLVISTSSIITAFFYPSNIYSISDDRWTKTE